MRKYFDDQLTQLDIDLKKLFGLVKNSMKMLRAEQMKEIALRHDISKELLVRAEEQSAIVEKRCVKLLIHQQPVASDLRKIKSALGVVYDLVRIVEMCNHILRMQVYASEKLPRLKKLLDESIRMVNKAIEAFLNLDKEVAEYVIGQDDNIDRDFAKLKSDIIKMLKYDDSLDDLCLDSLLVGKYFERIADHAVNISKTVLQIAVN